ncbi:unnamed protein product [Dicrocoelium dendriticum]|nr:unnamed protein product [Dicrocoelium dendriticum]
MFRLLQPQGRSPSAPHQAAPPTNDLLSSPPRPHRHSDRLHELTPPPPPPTRPPPAPRNPLPLQLGPPPPPRPPSPTHPSPGYPVVPRRPTAQIPLPFFTLTLPHAGAPPHPGPPPLRLPRTPRVRLGALILLRELARPPLPWLRAADSVPPNSTYPPTTPSSLISPPSEGSPGAYGPHPTPDRHRAARGPSFTSISHSPTNPYVLPV